MIETDENDNVIEKCFYVDCNGDRDGMAMLDECGICDGPGAIYQGGCHDILEDTCDCEGNIEFSECGAIVNTEMVGEWIFSTEALNNT